VAQNLELTFASKETSLSVRSFSVEHPVSGLFEISVIAVSPDDDLDLDVFVGQGASFRLGGSLTGALRAWTGVVAHMEQVEAEAGGLSTYYLRIVPALWRATRRKNNRIFQHLTLPEIAAVVLAEWGIEPLLELDATSFPRFEYRVQYGETDFAFLSRILEEAGVAYVFRDPDLSPSAKTEPETTLVLSTNLERQDARAGGPILYFNGNNAPKDKEIITAVKLAQELRAGRLTLRDYDFRSRPDLELLAEARSLSAIEEKLEVYDYVPGAFLVEPEVASARIDEKESKALATRKLASIRRARRAVTYGVTVLDLAPGTVFTITGHARTDIDKRRMLAVRQTLQGTRDGEWTVTGQAVFADEAYRPSLTTQKPAIPGLQSALVVGPPGAEIHTDEHGRVRVQFHWDREGKRDDRSSCFLRVSQAWAGRGFGVQAIPRVGDEVLVGFFEGDPDQPVIVGRVHNSASRTPMSLPEQKTQSTWKSESTPGGGGWNEITFDDDKGHEKVFMRAERDLERLVKQDESVTIGGSIETAIGGSESRAVTADQTLTIGGSRTSHVVTSETISVGESYRLALGDGSTGVAITSDKRIVLTTGQASIVLDGPNIYFDGQASVRLSAGELVSLAGGEVHVDGKPNVYLNSTTAAAPGVLDLDKASSDLTSVTLPFTPEEEALTQLLATPVEAPGAAPDAIVLPAFIEEQLKAAREKIEQGAQQMEDAIKDRIAMVEDTIKGKINELKENLVPRVEAARAEAYALINSLRAKLEAVKAEAAARVAELKAKAEQIRAAVEAKIQEVRDLAESVKARARAVVDGVKQRIEDVRTRAREVVDGIKQRITDAKTQAKAVFDDLRSRAIAVRDKVQSEVDAVKGAIQGARDQVKQTVGQIKDAIEQTKQTIKDTVTTIKGDIEAAKTQAKELLGEIKNLPKEIKAEVKAVVQDAKTAFNETKQEAKDLFNQTKTEAKDLFNQTKTEAKDLFNQTKTEAKDLITSTKAEAKDLFNTTKAEAKDLFNTTKADVKETVKEAKDAFNATKTEIKADVKEAKDAFNATKAAIQTEVKTDVKEAKDAFNATKTAIQTDVKELKQEAKDLFKETKDAFQQSKSIFKDVASPVDPLKATQGEGFPVSGLRSSMQAFQGTAGQHAPAAFSAGTLGGGLPAAPAMPAMPAMPPSAMVTRAGGFGGEGVANAINSNTGATFLQSPSEGQLMVMRTQASMPLSPAALSTKVVDHQMNGLSSSDAFAGALRDHGYALYERPWDSEAGSEFLKKAVL
jgi:type VI secretion system secreted protein VgrG